MTRSVGSLEQLGAFDGRVTYLFGIRDHLIPLPAPGALPGAPRRQRAHHMPRAA